MRCIFVDPQRADDAVVNLYRSLFIDRERQLRYFVSPCGPVPNDGVAWLVWWTRLAPLSLERPSVCQGVAFSLPAGLEEALASPVRRRRRAMVFTAANVCTER